jgi:hypothetical protein
MRIRTALTAEGGSWTLFLILHNLAIICMGSSTDDSGAETSLQMSGYYLICFSGTSWMLVWHRVPKTDSLHFTLLAMLLLQILLHCLKFSPFSIHVLEVGLILRESPEVPFTFNQVTLSFVAGTHFIIISLSLSTRDYWVLGFYSSSGILQNTTFRKLDLFPPTGEGVANTWSVGSVRNN